MSIITKIFVHIHIAMVNTTENANEVEKVKENRYTLSLFLKVAIEVADRTSSGSSFHNLGALYAKLRPKV